MDDGNFLLELDKIGSGPAPSESPQRRGFWAAGNSTSGEDDLGDVPNFDAASHAARVASEADEPDIDADAETIPNYLAALVILLCTCVGAGGAVVVLHDRVQQIVAAWTIAAH